MSRGREPVGGCGDNHCPVGGKRSALELPRPVAKEARSAGRPGAVGAAGVPCRADCALVGGNRYYEGKEAECGYDADDEVRLMTQERAWAAMGLQPGRLRAALLNNDGTGSGSDLEHQGASGDWAAPGDQPLISSCFQLVDSTCFDIAVMSSDELAHFWFNFVMHEQSLGCWKSASTRRHVRERARQLGIGIYAAY